MAGSAGRALEQTEIVARPEDYLLPHWYAVYTSAHHEKRVAEQLSMRSVEQFLPLYRSVRMWKDRRVELELPLFPGYVFVRTVLRDRLRILQVPGVANLVGFGGTPTALPESDVERLKQGLAAGVGAQPHPFLTVGRNVRIRSGPLAGMVGILLRRKNAVRVVVSLRLIQRSVALEVDATQLEPVFRG